MKDDSKKQELNQNIPSDGTNSALRYFNSITRDLNFFFFIINTVLVADYLPYHAKKALENIDGKISEEDIIKNPFELMEKEPGKGIKKLRRHSQEFIEMILSRLIDNFQVYVVSLIREILQVKSEILINNQPTISISQVLKASSLEILVQESIESKVSTLAHKGFGNIEEWCLSNGIPITVNPEAKADIV